METGPPRNQKPVAVHTTRAHFAAYTPPGLNRSTPSSCWLCSDVLLFYARLSATGGAPSQQLQQSVDPVLFARAIEASLHTLHTACGYEFRRSPPSHTWRLFFVNTGPRIKKAKQETYHFVPTNNNRLDEATTYSRRSLSFGTALYSIGGSRRSSSRK